MQNSLQDTTRIHIGLGTRDLSTSIAFYRTLLGGEPTKLREAYAKFEPTGLPLNLSLVETSSPATAPTHHFGLQVGSSEAVMRRVREFRASGLAVEVQEGVDCCYAVQDKVWVSDPDGNRWEVFHVLGEGSSLSDPKDPACCEEPVSCCSSPG